MRIVVIGMGYVGIPCAALLADVPGFQVVGVQRRSDRSGWKIDCLNSGKSPFEGDEPGLAELIHRVACEKMSFQVTDDFAACAAAGAILIDVQTPVAGCGTPQYESLRTVSGEVARHMQPGTLVIVESTVAPGTIQHVVQPVLEQESGLRGGDDFYLAFSYERVMPGKLLEYITDFPRVVGGIDPESTRRAVALYRHIVKGPITPTDTLTAEMAKVVENAYRDVNIAFANEVARACERMGVNVFEIREMINARPDRHMHIPGAGVGGHCLPKDSRLLKYGLEMYSNGRCPDSAAVAFLRFPAAAEIKTQARPDVSAASLAAFSNRSASPDSLSTATMFTRICVPTRSNPRQPIRSARWASAASSSASETRTATAAGRWNLSSWR